MKNIKKLSTRIGTLATIVSPMAALSCGDDKGNEKFNFNDDLAKVATTIISTKDKATLGAHVESKKVGDAVTASELGVIMPTFSPGVTASHAVATVYNVDSATIFVTTTLIKDEETVKIDITITAKATPISFDENLAE